MDEFDQYKVNKGEVDEFEQYKVQPFKGTGETQLKTAPPRWVEPLQKASEMIGLTGGAILGAPLGPVGGVAGAGLGYAGSKGLYDKAMEMMGIFKPTGIGETAIQTGKDILTGGAYQAGGDIGGKIITKTAEKILSPYGARVSSDEGKELLRIYKEFNIKPFPAETVPDQKTLSILEGVLGYRPISGDVMIKESAKKLKALHTVRDQLIDKGALNQDIELVGNFIRKEAKNMLSKYSQSKGDKLEGLVDDFVTKFGTKGRFQSGQKFEEVMVGDRTSRQVANKEAYNEVKDLLPKKGKDVIEIVPEDKELAKRLLREEMSKLKPLQDEETISLLKEIIKEPKLPEGVTPFMLQRDPSLRKSLEEKIPKITWEGSDQSRSVLLDKIREIHKNRGEATPKTRIYDELQQILDRGMARYAEKVGGDVGTKFLDARSMVREMHELYDKDMLRIMNKPVEDILGKIVKGGEVTLLQQIKGATGDAGLEPLRQGFFGEVIKQSTKNGVVDPKIMQRLLTKPGMQETLTELTTPQQLSMFQNIVNKGLFFTNKQQGMKTVEFLETLSGGTNEGIVNHIFRPNNRENIQLAKKLLSPERMKEIESLAIEKVLILSKAGNYLPVSSAGQFIKYNIPLKELLGTEKFNSLTSFIKIGQNMKKVESLALNASQTGQVLMGSQIGGNIINTLSDMTLKKVVGMGGTLGIPWLVSKIYVSDMALKYFTNAIKLSPSSSMAISQFMKSLAIIAEDIDQDRIKQQGE